MDELLIHITDELKQHRWLPLLLLFLAIFRLSLTNSGHLFDLDEKRYNNALHLLEIRNKDINKALYYLFEPELQNRPGFVLVNVIPALVQKSLLKAGVISDAGLDYYNIPSIFNVFYTLAICVLLYRILWMLTKQNQWVSLVGTLIYGLLCNSYLYVRHLVPYDIALLLFISALYLTLRAKTTSGTISGRKAVLLGLLCAFAFTVYPGYYTFVLVIAVLILTMTNRRIQATLLFLFSAASVIGIYEVVARSFGLSYFLNSYEWSMTSIIQGSFEESFIFLPQYFLLVEGGIGVALLALLIYYVIFVFPKAAKDDPFRPIMFMAALGYLIHGFQGFYFHRMVFYGRLVHMYVPFIILGAMLAIASIQNIKYQRIVVLLVCGLSLISFATVAPHYYQLVYPRDLDEKYLNKIPYHQVYRLNQTEAPREEYEDGKYRALALNLKNLYPITTKVYGITPFPPKGMVKVISVPHTMQFIGYQLEGYSIYMRRLMNTRNYRMEIYMDESIIHDK